MKNDFGEIAGIAARIMAEAHSYQENETKEYTALAIRYIKEFADEIIGIAESMELELGEEVPKLENEWDLLEQWETEYEELKNGRTVEESNTTGSAVANTKC